MKGYRKVVIAVNGKIGVLDEGLRLAADEKCWVTVVKVIPSHEGELHLTGVRNLGDVLTNEKERVAAVIGNRADDQGALVKTIISEGAIDEKIVQVAREERCDVIVMGSPKRSWMRRLFGDHVVEKVIRRAPCPVFVVGS